MVESESQKTGLKRRGNRHAKPEVRQEQILQAAVSCFGKQGYFNTTMDDIVKASGLSKGSLYRFFQSKDDLLMAIVDGWAQSAEVGLAEFAENHAPVEALKRYCLFTIEMFKRDGKMLGVWIQFFQHAAARQKLQAIHQYERKHMQRLILNAKQAGEVEVESPMAAADHLRAILEGTMIIASVDQSVDPIKRFLSAWQGFEQSLRP